jgi:hypothetical protein
MRVESEFRPRAAAGATHRRILAVIESASLAAFETPSS